VTAMVRYDDVEVGTELPLQRSTLQRVDLVRYAGASGDLNPLHWNERFATAVGLPDVIAHGMLTMGRAGRVLTDWAGDPGAVEEYGVRFTRPVVVPDDGAGATLTVHGRVTGKLDDRRVSVELSVLAGEGDGEKVLSRARAVVRLA